MTLKQYIKSITPHRAKEVIASYYHNKSFGIKRDKELQQVPSKQAVKALVNSKENYNGATILSSTATEMFAITEKKTKTKPSYSLRCYDLMTGEVINTWSESTLSKILSFVPRPTDGYWIAIDANMKFKVASKSDIGDRKYAEGEHNLYAVANEVRSLTSKYFNTIFAKKENEIKTLVEKREYIRANKALSKILKSGRSYSSESTIVELNDVVDQSWGRSIHQRIEDNIKLSSFYETSSLAEIRTEGAKVYSKIKNRIDTYFDVEE